MEKHNYTNPSHIQDLSHIEVGISIDEERDSSGFTKRKPISDRECIYKCLRNCEQMTGLNKKQVQRLMKHFKVMENDAEAILNEYPPL